MRPLAGTKRKDSLTGHRRYHTGTCPVTGKRSFPSRAKAIKDLKQVQSGLAVRNAYQCPHCGDWRPTRRVPRPKGTG